MCVSSRLRRFRPGLLAPFYSSLPFLFPFPLPSHHHYFPLSPLSTKPKHKWHRAMPTATVMTKNLKPVRFSLHGARACVLIFFLVRCSSVEFSLCGRMVSLYRSMFCVCVCMLVCIMMCVSLCPPPVCLSSPALHCPHLSWSSPPRAPRSPRSVFFSRWSEHHEHVLLLPRCLLCCCSCS